MRDDGQCGCSSNGSNRSSNSRTLNINSDNLAY